MSKQASQGLYSSSKGIRSRAMSSQTAFAPCENAPRNDAPQRAQRSPSNSRLIHICLAFRKYGEPPRHKSPRRSSQRGRETPKIEEGWGEQRRGAPANYGPSILKAPNSPSPAPKRVNLRTLGRLVVLIARALPRQFAGAVKGV